MTSTSSSTTTNTTADASAALTAADPPAAYRWRWLVLAIVLVAEVMDLLDSTIITVAAPTVRDELGGSAAVMQWWAAGYTLAFGVFLIIGGRLGDIHGRRRLFIIGIIGFTLASSACALAPTPETLIVFRVLQGAFGAVLIPQGLGLIKQVFPPEEMTGAFAAFGPVMGLSAVCGPILAGWLVGADLLGTGWRMIFLINLPLGLLGLVGALRILPESPRRTDLRLDARGVGLIAAALFCIIYPLVQGRELGWPAWVFAMLAGGVVLLGAFGWSERRSHGTPIIEPSLLRNRTFVSGLVVGTVFFTAFGGLLLVFSLFAQLGLHFSALHTGLSMAPMSLGIAVGAPTSYVLMPRFGRGVLHLGLAVLIPALVALALTVSHWGTATTTWELAPSLAVVGLGMGWVFGPLFSVILAGVQEHEVGSASGVLTAIQQLGSALGVAVLATVFFTLLDHGHPSTTAMVRTTLVSAGLFAVAFLLAFRLPREARLDGHG
jgi:EmrB/QacA subfamily drug resistance transporter